ncbi:MAG TPA: ferrous iron transport protein B [Candidatus Deferrimicrobium sp.]|nr:ferrous iron transport protein B [Candidatus Deferrimicrobium sp.]
MSSQTAASSGPGIGVKTVAICGNPNSGKTTIFNAITGLNQRVANYPGVTVEKVSGRFTADKGQTQHFTLTDVPGTYSLAAYSPDEYIAAAALFGSSVDASTPDVIVCVIDATNLERGLYLLLQVLEIGRPVVVALNMFDLAQRRGMRIDLTKLSAALGGIPVVPVVANRGYGIAPLKSAMARAAGLSSAATFNAGLYGPATESALERLQASFRKGGHTRAECLRIIFDVGGPAETRFVRAHGESARRELEESRCLIRGALDSLSAAETAPLTGRAAEIFASSVTVDRSRQRLFSDKVDRYLLHPVLGPVVLLTMMAFMFQSIFSWARPFMELIDLTFSRLSGQVATIIPEGPVQSLLTDGVIGGVGSVLAFIPQIAFLFVFIGLLEDSGYMARAAFLVDRMFRWSGLSGKSFIPMLSSFACAVPGIMATRTIEDRKLRLVTMMVSPLMTCSARLPVYAVMIAAFVPYESYFGIFNLQGIVLALLYLLGVVVAGAAAFVMSRLILKTQSGTFMMEMPSYKLPTLRSVGIRVVNRVRSFVARAGTVILAITVVIWALSYYPRSQNSADSYDGKVAGLHAQYDARRTALLTASAVSADPQNDKIEALTAELTDSLSTASDPATLAALSSRLTALYPGQEETIARLADLRRIDIDRATALRRLSRERDGEYLRNSYLGRLGRAVEPAFRPLGWDWQITLATLASFPAREVIIATLGTIYNLGNDIETESASLVDKIRAARWHDGPKAGRPVFTLSVALSIMVFFALCCQCGATIVTIKQESASWKYAAATFLYMTALAYLLALATYQVAAGLGV